MDLIQRPLWSVLPLVATLVLPQDVLKSKVHVDVCSPIVTGSMLMSLARVTREDHTDGWLWSGSLPEAMPMSIDWAVTRDHVDVSGLCNRLKPY